MRAGGRKGLWGGTGGYEDIVDVLATRDLRDRRGGLGRQAKADAERGVLPPGTPGAWVTSANLHVFYYAWYGAPKVDGEWRHWNHARIASWRENEADAHSTARHIPELDDLGSTFFPMLGAYSSRDPEVLRTHMQWISRSGAGVLVLSWYPPGLADDEGKDADLAAPAILDAAAEAGLAVAFQLEPYAGRSPLSVADDLAYLTATYGGHSGLYREHATGLPMVYVYDSYRSPPEEWAAVLAPGGASTVRGTTADALVLGLLLHAKDKEDIVSAGFDGAYTYFASEESRGSASHTTNWAELEDFYADRGLLFVPSAGPGYDDEDVRPWNGAATRNREGGQRFRRSLEAARDADPLFVSITSFNEWHEGSQIEPAVPKRRSARAKPSGSWPAADFREAYLDYGPETPFVYLDTLREVMLDWAMRAGQGTPDQRLGRRNVPRPAGSKGGGR